MKSIIFELFFKLELLIIKHTNKKSHLFRKFVINKARLIANGIFPDNTHGENIDISIAAVYKLVFDKNIVEDHEHYENIIELIENIKENEEIKRLMSDYFLAQSYAFSLAKLSKAANLTTAQEIEEEYFEKAQFFYAKSEKFTEENFKKKLSTLKKDVQISDKELHEILENKVKKDREDMFEPIEINSSNVTLFTSLFSTLFVISGYYYTHEVFQYFGINSDNFFSISDYLSTSVSLVLTPLSWTLIATFIYILGANRGLGRLLANRQLSIEEKEKPPYSIVLLIVSLNALNIHALITEQKEIESATSMVMYLNFLVIGFYCIERLPWHYFKNSIKVLFSLVAILGFTLNINKLVYNQVELYQSSDYRPLYIVEFSKKNISKRPLEFISINSNYVFMRHKSTKEMEVYPKSFIVKLTPINTQIEKSMSLQDYLVNWIDLFVRLYRAIID